MYNIDMTRFQYQALSLVLVLIAAGALGFAYYSYSQASPEAVSAREVKEVIEAVEKHMVLPEGEEPTVATVSSLDQLAGQPFFANAKIGYKVLIYTQARKAILYDPEIDRIIEVSALAIDQNQ